MDCFLLLASPPSRTAYAAGMVLERWPRNQDGRKDRSGGRGNRFCVRPMASGRSRCPLFASAELGEVEGVGLGAAFGLEKGQKGLALDEPESRSGP